MASDYRFLTAWLLDAERRAVWWTLRDAERWPEWWRGVERVTVLDPDARYRIAWRSRIPYELEFEFTVRELEEPRSMTGDATGALTGTGRWRLFEQDGVTAVTYEWNVRTAQPWMNRLAPLARPAFRWNHDAIMRQGAEGLQRLLGAPLLVQS